MASGTPSLYSSPQVQVRMGLFGALIVRPTMGADYVYDRADSQFNPATEFMLLLSEIDPYLNAKVLKGTAAFNMNTYHPRYWLINGRQFPDSIADNFASWLPEPAVRVPRDDPPVRRDRPTRCRPSTAT